MRHARRRAALLLEIVVALTIMIAAMALVGGQLVGGLQWVSFSDQQARADALADRVMALLELDRATQAQLFLDKDTTGDFGKQYPEFMWRAYVSPTDTDGLGQVTVQILYQPKEDLQGEADRAMVLRELHVLKADPGRIDFARDFGMEQEVVDQLGGTLGSVGIDPTQFNPQDLVSLPPETLLEMVMQIMPALQAAMGGQLPGGLPGGLGDLGGFDPMNPQAMQEMIQNRMRDALGGGGGGGAQDVLVGDRGEDGAGGFQPRVPGGLDEGGGSDGGGRGGRPRIMPFGGGAGGRGGDGQPGGAMGGGGRRGGAGRGGADGAGGRGGRRGGAGGAGISPDALQQLRDLQAQAGAGGDRPRRGGRGGGEGANSGGNGGPGGDTRGRGGRGGGRGGGAGGQAGGGGQGDKPLTIEDLNRLREQLNQRAGGKRGG